MLNVRLALALFVFFALLAPSRALAYPYLSMMPSTCGWHVIASPSMNVDGNELLSVSALNDHDAWAVGESSDNFSGDYFPLVEHWNGTAWSLVTVPEPDNTYLSSVRALSANDVWAVGGSQNQSTFIDQTYVIHWNGSTWMVVSSPNIGGQSNDFNALAKTDMSDIWGVGSYFSTVTSSQQTLTEHWNGSSWSVFASPDVNGVNNELLGAGAERSSDVWAVGDSGDPINVVAQTLIEHWNGAAWSIVSSPTVGSYSILRTVAPNTRTDDWAFGETFSSSILVPLAEHWNGSSWSIVSTPTVSGVDTALFASFALSSTDVWAVGNSYGNDRTFTINWNGSTWTQVPSPNRGTHSNDLYGLGRIPGTMNLWAVGRSGGANFTFKTLVMKFHC